MSNLTIIESEKITKETKDSIVNLTLHTLKKDKQILIFNNSKRSSESTAEKIADAIKLPSNKKELEELSNKILKTLQNPTKQCKKLSKCILKSIAFHHSGLTSKQRSLIEDAFKKGIIKVISSTPTLAAGLNLPAYQVIIKDYKRYSSRGMNDIPILEYHQMSGRAGRPGKETIGKAVIHIATENEVNRIIPKYIFGKPEELISKLAVEPILKMHLLSLVSMNIINTKSEIKEFFSNTLYAKQYGDLDSLTKNIFRIIENLKSYSFINQEDDFYMATKIGKKVSELYLNPDTANYFLENIDKYSKTFSFKKYSKNEIYSLINFLTKTKEMKPLFRIYKNEEDFYLKKLDESPKFLIEEYDPFEEDYETFLNSLKTTDILYDWINEAPEDYITEKYKITPGELNYKTEIIDWLLYSLEELVILKKDPYFKNILNKIRLRFKHGVKEDILSLISLKGVGRVRARKLQKEGFKNLNEIKYANINQLSKIIGEKLANKIKQELSGGIQPINNLIDEKPNEIKNRDVSEDEVELYVENYTTFEKEKEEKQKRLTSFF